MSLLTSAPRRGQMLNDTVLSASPARQRTMLCDRLVHDLDEAGKAQVAGNRSEANTHLGHAQEIIGGLIVALDARGREAGPGLRPLYNHFLNELVRAGITHDADRTAACREWVETLRAAWHESAAGLSASAALPAVPAPMAIALGRRAVGRQGAVSRSWLRIARGSRLVLRSVLRSVLGNVLVIPLVIPRAPRRESRPTR